MNFKLNEDQEGQIIDLFFKEDYLYEYNKKNKNLKEKSIKEYLISWLNDYVYITTLTEISFYELFQDLEDFSLVDSEYRNLDMKFTKFIIESFLIKSDYLKNELKIDNFDLFKKSIEQLKKVGFKYGEEKLGCIECSGLGVYSYNDEIEEEEECDTCEGEGDIFKEKTSLTKDSIDLLEELEDKNLTELEYRGMDASIALMIIEKELHSDDIYDIIPELKIYKNIKSF